MSKIKTNPEPDIDAVDPIVARFGGRPDAAIPILQAIQREFGYLPIEALRRVCATSEITPAAIEGIASFFPQFRRAPAGKHTICVCDGTACHLKGAPAVYDAVAKDLDLAPGEHTDREGLFTLETVRCLGCCTLAPAVQIDGVTYGHVEPSGTARMLEDFLAQASQERIPEESLRSGPPECGAEIRIGLGSCCVAGGSDRIRAVLEDTVAAYDLPVRVKRVSCVGMCHQTPLLEILIQGQTPKFYAELQPDDVPSIVLSHFPPRGAAVRLRAKASGWIERLYTDEARRIPERRAIDSEAGPVAEFLSVQQRLATEYCGEIDPTDLDEYFARGGFQALRRCLDGSPEKTIETIRGSGLRGRGGAGFPTARKWDEVRRAPGDVKYVICNGDEGDPGAFMDRMILESYPYRVIEGLIVASVAVGAHCGIIYIRAEYPLAVARVRTALAKCVEAGILGDRVFVSAHAFHVEVREGAGAFVCGEETALIASLEGKRPTPRYRPPYPARQGLHGCPTLVNNVETLSLVPWILRHGPEAFAQFGSATSKGTKVFALAGKVRRGGLIEVPMGVTIRQVVEAIGGGVAPGRTLKAVQVGGPSGGCVPARLADLTVDYEALTQAGAMMGSGGFVVLDDTDCIVEMSRYFLSFTQLESCGKCTPCRIGTKEMLDILTRLCEGTGTKADLDRLETIAGVVRRQSLCGLGKTAPNPVLTGLAHFREEFEAHVEGHCPAHVCKALVHYTITQECTGCTKCAQQCPADAIRMTPYEVHEIDQAKCVRCGGCHAVCPVGAVEVS